MPTEKEILRLALRVLGNCMSKNTAFTVGDYWMQITGIQRVATWTNATTPDLDLIGDAAYKLFSEGK
jgi:hypothetical protein